jgi:hypothetical protein
VFKSVTDLITKVRAFIDGWNDRSHPFVWTKTAEEILKKANPSNNLTSAPLGSVSNLVTRPTPQGLRSRPEVPMT